MTAAHPDTELTVEQVTYTRGAIGGRSVLVIYNAVTDKTQVITTDSKFYPQAMAALDVLEAVSTPIPGFDRQLVRGSAKRPRIIRTRMQ